ncbi:MAG: hypothetical protein ABFE13_06075 [Phycisphaerales bacterium]
MNDGKDERWLDEQIERAVNGSTPVFDAESWRKTHAGEYEILLARHDRSDGCGIRSVWARRAAGLAIAAAVVMGVALFFVDGPGSEEPVAPTLPVVRSAAEMMTMRSLRLAYEQGGEEALNRQLDMALDQLGPRLDGFSTLRVVRDLDG